jgi:hypothetical protein
MRTVCAHIGECALPSCGTPQTTSSERSCCATECDLYLSTQICCTSTSTGKKPIGSTDSCPLCAVELQWRHDVWRAIMAGSVDDGQSPEPCLRVGHDVACSDAVRTWRAASCGGFIGFVTRRSARHCRTPVALSVQRTCGRLHSAAAMTRSLQFCASVICIDT